jgi:hypothetical protein
MNKLYVWYYGEPCSVCGGQRHLHKTRMRGRNTQDIWIRLKWRHGFGALLKATAPMRTSKPSEALQPKPQAK